MCLLLWVLLLAMLVLILMSYIVTCIVNKQLNVVMVGVTEFNKRVAVRQQESGLACSIVV